MIKLKKDKKKLKKNKVLFQWKVLYKKEKEHYFVRRKGMLSSAQLVFINNKIICEDFQICAKLKQYDR
jgi:hypothetical protein